MSPLEVLIIVGSVSLLLTLCGCILVASSVRSQQSILRAQVAEEEYHLEQEILRIGMHNLAKTPAGRELIALNGRGHQPKMSRYIQAEERQLNIVMVAKPISITVPRRSDTEFAAPARSNKLKALFFSDRKFALAFLLTMLILVSGIGISFSIGFQQSESAALAAQTAAAQELEIARLTQELAAEQQSTQMEAAAALEAIERERTRQLDLMLQATRISFAFILLAGVLAIVVVGFIATMVASKNIQASRSTPSTRKIRRRKVV